MNYCLLLIFCLGSQLTGAIIPPRELADPTILITKFPYARKTHYPLLSGETFRAFGDHIIDETGIPFEPSSVIAGDIIFVAMPYLRFFFKELLPLIEEPFVLLTTNGSGTVDERYRAYLEDPKLTAWFGRNITLVHSKVRLIPLGVCWDNRPGCSQSIQLLKKTFANFQPGRFFEEKPIHTYLCVNTNTHASRPVVKEYFTTQEYCLIAHSKPFPIYLKDLAQSRFVLSPRGVNIDCFRTWEALYAGAIPVVESWGIDSLYEDLPIIIVESLVGVTCDLLDQEFEKLKSKKLNLEKLHADYWQQELRAAQNKCR